MFTKTFRNPGVWRWISGLAQKLDPPAKRGQQVKMNKSKKTGRCDKKTWKRLHIGKACFALPGATRRTVWTAGTAWTAARGYRGRLQTKQLVSKRGAGRGHGGLRRPFRRVRPMLVSRLKRGWRDRVRDFVDDHDR